MKLTLTTDDGEVLNVCDDADGDPGSLGPDDAVRSLALRGCLSPRSPMK